MRRSNTIIAMFAIWTVAWPAFAIASSAPTKSTSQPTDKRSDRLPVSEYITMQPFVIPIVDNGKHVRNYTLVVALKLGREDHGVSIRRVVPRIRDKMYQALFRLISFRTTKPRIPHDVVIRRKLVQVAQRETSTEQVTDLVLFRVSIDELP